MKLPSAPVALILACALACSLPAQARPVIVHLGPAGDIVTITIPIINNTGDYIRGGSYHLSGSTLTTAMVGGDVTFTPSNAVNSTAQVVIEADGTYIPGVYSLGSLYGFVFSGIGGTPPGNLPFTYTDPNLQVDLEPNNGNAFLPVDGTYGETVVLPASLSQPAPEPSPLAAFVFTGLGVAGLIMIARRRTS